MNKMTKNEIKTWLTARVAEVISVSPDAIDPEQPFSSYGLDSLRLSKLAAEGQAALDRAIDVTSLFEYHSIALLTDHLSKVVSETSIIPTPRAGFVREPIAITGISCRLPGARDKDSFWKLLEDGVDGVSLVPPGRWDFAPWHEEGRKIGWGGFLADVRGFDARFFRISDEESRRMDPQQRLLLEVCWEALEDAGEIPARLRGSNTGVFLGISGNEYFYRQLANADSINAYTVSGNSLSIAANRVSYIFDFHGPSLSVDTACSSSLVALHLAYRSIAAGDCDRAIVAGANLLLAPEVSLGLSRANMLSPEGRCRAFDADANGYVRGEGVGAIVLKSRAAATANGDRVYALVRGSAINQDGSSNGMTAPNPAAQRDVLRRAYADAGVRPGDVDYVECHGTGTFLGDPIEAKSLGAVVTEPRKPENRCYIGSVKSNIGHLEAAAGIAGVIKTALGIYYKKIPGNLHFSRPNLNIPFDELKLRVVDRTIDWPANGDTRLAGVSSFGFGGTNAHAVMESCDSEDSPVASQQSLLLPISAASETSLRKMIASWRQLVDSVSDQEVCCLAQNACLRRTHHRAFRVAVAGRGPGTLRQQLRTLDRESEHTLSALLPVPSRPPRIAFIFPGQGSQFTGMASDLLETSSIFRSLIRSHDALVGNIFGWSIEKRIRGEQHYSLDDGSVVQPILTSIQIALARMLNGLGVEPAAVVGHSLGEIAAAVCSGVLETKAGLLLAHRRGQLTNEVSREGGMLATNLERREAELYVQRSSCSISLAAVNGASISVLAGSKNELQTVKQDLAKRQVAAQWLNVNQAFHSRCMDAVKTALEQELSELRPETAKVPMYSTLLGRKLEHGEADGRYWGRGVRETVEFGAAVSALIGDGIDVLLEVGPQAVLRGALRQLSAGAQPIKVLAAFDKGGDARYRLQECLGVLYTLGCGIRWSSLFTERVAMRSMPSYCWDHAEFWMDPPPRRTLETTESLLGKRTDAGSTERNHRWESTLDTRRYGFLNGHRVDGSVVFPGSGFLELIREAWLQAGHSGPLVAANIKLHRVLPLSDAPVQLRTEMEPSQAGAPGGMLISISSRQLGAHTEWVLNATAELDHSAKNAESVNGFNQTKEEELQGLSPYPPREFYRVMADRGFEYGEEFQLLNAIWRRDGAALGVLTLQEGIPATGDRIRVLDAALQLVAAAVPAGAYKSASRLLPYSIRSLWVATGAAQAAKVYARAELIGKDELAGTVSIYDSSENIIARVEHLQLRPSGPRNQPQAFSDFHLYETIWRERPAAPMQKDTLREKGAWIVLADSCGYGRTLAEELWRYGIPAILCAAGEEFHCKNALEMTIHPHQPEDYRQLIDWAVRQHGPLAGVIHLWGIETNSLNDSGSEAEPPGLISTLHLLKALAYSPAASAARLIAATCGAQPIGDDAAGVDDPTGAVIWGLLKTVPVENALLPLACVDLEPGSTSVINELLNEMTSELSELEVGYRNKRRFVRRLIPLSNAAASHSFHARPIREDAAYVITGGTGALGIQLAELLAKQGARHLALISRTAQDYASHAVINKLRLSGVNVMLLSANVGEPSALEEALASVRRSGYPIQGIIHAAGVRRDGALLDMTTGDFAKVMEAKVRGTWNLHRATLRDPLHWFVLFSSAAGVLGSPGQANYSAANAFLDSFAHYRHSLGLPALAIAWGAWAGGGMASGSPESAEAMRLRTAASTIDPERGLALFQHFLAGNRTQVVALPFDLTNLLQFYPGKVGMSFFEELTTPEVAALKGHGHQTAKRPQLANDYVAPRNDIERRIVSIWERSLAVEPVGVLDSFFELGGDSVFANQMLIEVNRILAVSIEPAKAFEALTVANLAQLAQEKAVELLQSMTEAEARALLSQNNVLPPITIST